MIRNRLLLSLFGICLFVTVSQARVSTAPAAPGQRGGRGAAPRDTLDLLATQAALQSAQARGGTAGNLQSAWWNDSALTSKLGLTDLQKLRIENSFQAYRQSLTSAKESLEKEEAQLSKLLDADSIDKTSVMLQVNKVIQARSEMERINS